MKLNEDFLRIIFEQGDNTIILIRSINAEILAVDNGFSGYSVNSLVLVKKQRETLERTLNKAEEILKVYGI